MSDERNCGNCGRDVQRDDKCRVCPSHPSPQRPNLWIPMKVTTSKKSCESCRHTFSMDFRSRCHACEVVNGEPDLWEGQRNNKEETTVKINEPFGSAEEKEISRGDYSPCGGAFGPEGGGAYGYCSACVHMGSADADPCHHCGALTDAANKKKDLGEDVKEEVKKSSFVQTGDFNKAIDRAIKRLDDHKRKNVWWRRIVRCGHWRSNKR